MTIDERISFLVQSAESHDRQIGELTEAVSKLVKVSNEDATAIRTLARVVEIHEHRIADRKEGGLKGLRPRDCGGRNCRSVAQGAPIADIAGTLVVLWAVF